MLPRLLVTSHGPCSQPDNSHVVLHRITLQCLEDLADRSGSRIVGLGLTEKVRIEALHAMHRAPMQKDAAIFFGIIRHMVDAEEAALTVKDVAIGAGIKLARQDQRRKAQRKSPGPPAQTQAPKRSRRKDDEVI